MNQRDTDTLVNIVKEYCRDDKEVDLVRRVLKETLCVYQWHYQTAKNKVYRDVENPSAKAIQRVLELLRDKGQNTLAEEMEDALYNDANSSVLVKSKVISQVTKYMKTLLLYNGMSTSRYKNDFARLMARAFIDHCKQYPLDKAPEHFDSNFEPMI